MQRNTVERVHKTKKGTGFKSNHCIFRIDDSNSAQRIFGVVNKARFLYDPGPWASMHLAVSCVQPQRLNHVREHQVVLQSPIAVRFSNLVDGIGQSLVRVGGQILQMQTGHQMAPKNMLLLHREMLYFLRLFLPNSIVLKLNELRQLPNGQPAWTCTELP